MTVRWRRILARAAAAAIPALLVLAALSGTRQSAFFSGVILILSMVPFFLYFERSRPQARRIVPVALLSAVAVVGRLAFAFAPQFKPTTAVILISGLCFGPSAGFLTGAVTALASNFFLGQGAWTPWQMAAWGLVGWLGGWLSRRSGVPRRGTLAVTGVVTAFLYGGIMNLWHVIGFVRPLTTGTVLAAYAAGFVFDLVHAGSTALFLVLLGPPWIRRIRRIQRKYGLSEMSDIVDSDGRNPVE